ncbi:granzyme H-like [Pithys albifrons albifrons]|uniref:granzyme H-like n=1 Tax=Pithys albifrons albifrons TaxID=3385563 RepID=UPI003A5CDDC9
MEHLQMLLLPLLLVTCPPVSTSHSWNQREGGGEARTTSTPYVAHLQGKNNRSCAGFLVAPNWVMTAAQCLVHKPLTVILGAHTVQRKEKSWQKFEVKEYYCHPAFTSPKKGNDILLLKLNGNATSNSRVRTISFDKTRDRGGDMCSTEGCKTPAGTLQGTTVTIIKQRNCLSNYPGLADHLICGHSSSAEIPGKEDAGAPLVCNNKAFGIFSYRHKNWPGFYTHISHFLPWVNSVIKSA